MDIVDEHVTPLLDSVALIAAATAAGYKISPRMLESFRAELLLPRPERAGNRGRAPTWIYPAGADRQLLNLLGWRAHTKNPATLRVLLWLDGFPIPPEAVRNSLVHGLESMLALFDKEITAQAERQGLDPGRDEDRQAAVRQLAGVFAAKRGPGSLPRRARVRAADRAHALELVLRLFAFGEQIHAAPGEAEIVERVLGVGPNARRDRVGDAEPWLTGPAEDLFDAAAFIAVPNALNAVRGSTDADLDTARGLVATIFRYLPLMARMIGAVFDDENYAGFAALRELDRRPEFVMLLVPMVLGMLRAGWDENLRTVATALAPFPGLAAQAERILEMPAKSVAANLADEPAGVQLTARRLIGGAVEGYFDQSLPSRQTGHNVDSTSCGVPKG